MTINGSPMMYYSSIRGENLPVLMGSDGRFKLGYAKYEGRVHYVGVPVDETNSEHRQLVKWALDPSIVTTGLALSSGNPKYLLADQMLYNVPMISMTAVLDGVVEHPFDSNILVPVGLPIFLPNSLRLNKYLVYTKYSKCEGVPVDPIAGWIFTDRRKYGHRIPRHVGIEEYVGNIKKTFTRIYEARVTQRCDTESHRVMGTTTIEGQDLLTTSSHRYGNDYQDLPETEKVLCPNDSAYRRTTATTSIDHAKLDNNSSYRRHGFEPDGANTARHFTGRLDRAMGTVDNLKDHVVHVPPYLGHFDGRAPLIPVCADEPVSDSAQSDFSHTLQVTREPDVLPDLSSVAKYANYALQFKTSVPTPMKKPISVNSCHSGISAPLVNLQTGQKKDIRAEGEPMTKNPFSRIKFNTIVDGDRPDFLNTQTIYNEDASPKKQYKTNDYEHPGQKIFPHASTKELMFNTKISPTQGKEANIPMYSNTDEGSDKTELHPSLTREPCRPFLPSIATHKVDTNRAVSLNNDIKLTSLNGETLTERAVRLHNIWPRAQKEVLPSAGNVKSLMQRKRYDTPQDSESPWHAESMNTIKNGFAKLDRLVSDIAELAEASTILCQNIHRSQIASRRHVQLYNSLSSVAPKT